MVSRNDVSNGKKLKNEAKNVSKGELEVGDVIWWWRPAGPEVMVMRENGYGVPRYGMSKSSVNERVPVLLRQSTPRAYPLNSCHSERNLNTVKYLQSSRGCQRQLALPWSIKNTSVRLGS